MNLEDLIDPKYGLQQDEWSLTAKRFGDQGQLEVIGWSGRNRNDKGDKYYILKCNKCSQDSKLFGDGYFKSLKGQLLRGGVCCGCGKTSKWTKDQFAVLCSRKAEDLGYKFIDFAGEWEDKATKISMFCNKHGEWNTATIHTLLYMSSGCPGCRADACRKATTKPDEEMINSFFASGAFPSGTCFWRSDRKDTRGFKSYWYLQCPECNETGEAQSCHLQHGCRPCGCSSQQQKECYINLVLDDSNIIALKFGIAVDSKKRVKRQDLKSIYNVKQHAVYMFDSVAVCKEAEKECLQTLECGVVLKRDMPDGYTETTWAYNLDKIIEIYERNGGILVNA